MGLDFDVLEFSGSGVEVPIERTLGRLGIFSNLIDKVQGSDLSQLKKQELIRDINNAKSLEIVYGTENAEIASGLKTSYVFYELQDQEVSQVAKLEMPSREIVHTTLDVFGLTPGFGEMFDLVNAGIYFSEGDYLNGTVSLGSSVPVLGNYVAGLKLANSLEKAIEIGVKVDKDSQPILDPARQLPAAGKTTNNAYETAKSGGIHSGTLKNYQTKTIKQIEKALISHEKQVLEHQNKILNPQKYIPEWNSFTDERKMNTINKWYADIIRNQELSEVMKGILGK
jgi:hypothetical protein